MRHAWWFMLLACILLLPPRPATGGTVEEGAVVALLRRAPPGKQAQPDDAALRALGAVGGRDPWLLVEHFLTRDRQDLAVRFARFVDEAVFGPLIPYAEAPEPKGAAAKRRRALDAARTAKDARTWELALRHVASVAAGASRRTAFGVQALALRGDCLTASGETGRGIEAWILAAEDALQLGWWRRGWALFEQALNAAYAAGSYELAWRAAEGYHSVVALYGDVAHLADAEFNVGTVAEQRGDLPGALRHFNEALHLYDSMELHEEAASARSTRSFALAEIGEFDAALKDQQILRDFYAKRPHDAAWAQNQLVLGQIRNRLGDEHGASEALARALTASRSLGDKTIEASALGNLGISHRVGGRWDEAIKNYRQTLSLMESLGYEVSMATAKIAIADALMGKAESESRKEDVDPARQKAKQEAVQTSLKQARDLLDEVLPFAESAGAAGMACTARIAIAAVLLAQGRHTEAIKLLSRTQRDARRLHAWHSRISATVLLARAHLEAEDWDGALREAVAAAEELGRSFAGLAEADLARARTMNPDVFDIGVAAARRLNDNDALAYFLEAGRASALLRGLGGRAAALRSAVPESVVERFVEASRLRLVAYTAYRRSSKRGPRSRTQKLRKTYLALRKKEHTVSEEVAREQTKAAGRLAPDGMVDIRGVQSRLRHTKRRGLRQVFALFNFQRAEATALLIEQTKVRVVAYPTETLPELRAALATLSAARKGKLDPDALDTVSRLLIEPLDIPAGPTRLFVCPDRDLAYAPLRAIVPDEWELIWEPSATTYHLLAEDRLGRGRGVLGLGHPNYAAVPDRNALTTRGGPRLTDLPESRKEVEAITGSPRDRCLLGNEATEHGLARGLTDDGKPRRWHSVHLACHGLVDVEWPAFSCLALTPGDGEDGFLTSSEILRLPLKTDLAVLSACQTGRGKFVRGEGVMSLTRAFMFAGAPRVIVSLWDVDDAATSHLMQAFYRAWAENIGTAAALRKAQLAVRDHETEETIREEGKPPRTVKRHLWAHPKYWAAWTLWGLPD